MIRSDGHPMADKCREIDKGTLILMPGKVCMAIGPISYVSKHSGFAEGAWYCQVPVWNLTTQRLDYLASATAGSPQNAEYDWCQHYFVARKATIYPVGSPELDSYEDSDNI